MCDSHVKTKLIGLKYFLWSGGHIWSACTKHTQICSHRDGQKGSVSTLLRTAASSYYPILIRFPVKERVSHKPIHPHPSAPDSCALLKRHWDITLTFGCYSDTGDGKSFTLKERCWVFSWLLVRRWWPFWSLGWPLIVQNCTIRQTQIFINTHLMCCLRSKAGTLKSQTSRATTQLPTKGSRNPDEVIYLVDQNLVKLWPSRLQFVHHFCAANKATENFTAVIWLARKLNTRGDKIGEIKTGTKYFNPTFRSKKTRHNTFMAKYQTQRI